MALGHPGTSATQSWQAQLVAGSRLGAFAQDWVELPAQQQVGAIVKKMGHEPPKGQTEEQSRLSQRSGSELSEGWLGQGGPDVPCILESQVGQPPLKVPSSLCPVVSRVSSDLGFGAWQLVWTRSRPCLIA